MRQVVTEPVAVDRVVPVPEGAVDEAQDAELVARFGVDAEGARARLQPDPLALVEGGLGVRDEAPVGVLLRVPAVRVVHPAPAQLPDRDSDRAHGVGDLGVEPVAVLYGVDLPPVRDLGALVHGDPALEPERQGVRAKDDALQLAEGRVAVQRPLARRPQDHQLVLDPRLLDRGLEVEDDLGAGDLALPYEEPDAHRGREVDLDGRLLLGVHEFPEPHRLVQLLPGVLDPVVDRDPLALLGRLPAPRAAIAREPVQEGADLDPERGDLAVGPADRPDDRRDAHLREPRLDPPVELRPEYLLFKPLHPLVDMPADDVDVELRGHLPQLLELRLVGQQPARDAREAVLALPERHF